MFVGKHKIVGAPVYIELVSEMRRGTGCDGPSCRRLLQLYGFQTLNIMNGRYCSEKCITQALQQKYPLSRLRAGD